MIDIHAVGRVVGGRAEPDDDDWGDVRAVIRLDADRYGPPALAGLDEFSHLEVVYVFDRGDPQATETGSRHACRRADWHTVGNFSQRRQERPNNHSV